MITEGVINIYKPEGLTSHDVVARVRRRLGIRRTGHTGTLDPMATGVLPVCFGRATRMIEYYDGDFKTYKAELQLGGITDTLDSTGSFLEKRDFSQVTEAGLRDAVLSFEGEIRQVPPKYSALKVNGKPLYEYARNGLDVDVEKKARKVFIKSISIDSVDMTRGKVVFKVTCSKGTYIRTICGDIGEMLGCGAYMTALERTESGFFNLENSVDLDAFMEMSEEDIEKIVIPVDQTLLNLGQVRLNDRAMDNFQNGRPVNPEDMEVAGIVDFQKAGLYRAETLRNIVRVYDEKGCFAGTGRIESGDTEGYQKGSLKAVKVFRYE